MEGAATKRSAKSEETLRAEWEDLLAGAPPDPKGRPNPFELAALRAHKARAKKFLASLPPELRAALRAERRTSRRKEEKEEEEEEEEERKKRTAAAAAERGGGDEDSGEDGATGKGPGAASGSGPDPPGDPIAEALGARLGAEPTYLTKDGASWIIHARGWFPTPDEESFARHWEMHPTEFHELKLFGRTYFENRWSQSWGHNYRYSGSVSRSRELRSDDPDSEMVRLLIDRANDLVSGIIKGGPERAYNGCLQNWYEPDYTIGLHSDDEKDLREGYPIFSLSWGGTRRFVLKSRADSPSLCFEKTHDALLQDGDLLVMGGMCQRTHKHEVPKRRKTKDPPTSNRINWTIRAFLPQK